MSSIQEFRPSSCICTLQGKTEMQKEKTDKNQVEEYQWLGSGSPMHSPTVTSLI